MKKRARVKETTLLIIVKEQDGSGRSDWAGCYRWDIRETRPIFIHRIHRSLGADNYGGGVDGRLRTPPTWARNEDFLRRESVTVCCNVVSKEM